MINKKTIKFILSMVFFYIALSFSVWDLNAYNWDIKVRVFYVVIFIITSLLYTNFED